MAAAARALLGVFTFTSPRGGAAGDDGGPEDKEWAKVLESLVRILTGHGRLRFVPFYLLNKHGESSDNTPRRWRVVLGLEEIHYLPEDVDDPDRRVSLGRAAHEVWHLLYSRPELIFDEPELIRSMAFQALWWAIEDPRVNILGLKRHAGAKPWNDAAYAKDYEVRDLSAERAAFARLPLHIQFNYALIYEWWAGRADPRVTDHRVLEALREAALPIRKAYGTANAARSFAVVKEEVWPIYRRLVDEAYREAGEGGREGVEEAEQEFRDKHASKVVDSPERMDAEARAQAKKDLSKLRKKMGQEQSGDPRDAQEAQAAGDGDGEGSGEMTQAEREAQRKRLSTPDERPKDLDSEDEANYQEFKAKVWKLVPVVREQLRQALRRRIRRRSIHGRDSGDLDDEALNRIPGGSKDVFKEEMVSNKSLYRISLLIDTSGSMSREKRERAIEAAVMLMEALEGLPGLSYEIVAFDSAPRVLKSYNERIDSKKKSGVVRALIRGSGATESHVAVQQALQRIRMGRGDKMIIMVNDGDPDYNFDRDQYRAMVDAARDVEIHGIGLGEDAQLVLDLFPPGRGHWLEDVDRLAKHLRQILRKKILGR